MGHNCVKELGAEDLKTGIASGLCYRFGAGHPEVGKLLGAVKVLARIFGFVKDLDVRREVQLDRQSGERAPEGGRFGVVRRRLCAHIGINAKVVQ
jgi:hypothetical protein